MPFADSDEDEDFTASLFDDADLKALFPTRWRPARKPTPKKNGPALRIDARGQLRKRP